MGFPIACRLMAAGHRVVVFDTRPAVVDEAVALGLDTALAGAVAALWESTLVAEGPDSDFTSIVKPIEAAAGVVIGARES
jgi:3-hydroxyisobutyrate dehydrogenase-like beta-hydroxyacid dehydrogenase